MGTKDDVAELARTVTATGAGSDAPGAVAVPAAGGTERYDVAGEVARGGQGRILKARDRWLERDVALKEHQGSPAGRVRFLREALITARLQHPAIIPVHEVGQLPSGEPFIAMKLVDGKSLRDVIAERATLDARIELLPNIVAVADALAYAHSRRVIHRDLKPSNVLVGAFGETVVIDWGLAKELDAPEPAAVAADGTAAAGTTLAGAILGTPAYMPPEQAAGATADERSDVYMLGALIYHVVTGAPPYAGSDSGDVLARVRRGPPPPLREAEPRVAPELAAIVDKAMAREPADRYRDARELAAELRRFEVGMMPTGVAEPSTAVDAELEAGFAAEVRESAWRPLRVLLLLALILLPTFGIIEWITFHRASFAAARATATALLAALYVLARRPFGRRYSQQLAMSAVIVIGELLVIVNAMEQGALEGAFIASLIVVWMGLSALMPLSTAQLLAVFFAIAGSRVVAAFVFPPAPAASMLVIEVSLLVTATVIAAVASRVTLRLRAAEYYARRRLEAANRRLAKLERGRG